MMMKFFRSSDTKRNHKFISFALLTLEVTDCIHSNDAKHEKFKHFRTSENSSGILKL